MDSHKGLYSIEMMAQALNVSPRSYYNYKREKYTARTDRKEYLLSMIQEFYFKAKGRNGSPRIHAIEGRLSIQIAALILLLIY